MFATMKDLRVVSHTDNSVTLSVAGLKNPVELSLTKYDRGVVVQIPWVWTNRLSFPNYEALKAHLRSIFGHVETRTATDPRFTQAASARSVAVPSSRSLVPVHA